MEITTKQFTIKATDADGRSYTLLITELYQAFPGDPITSLPTSASATLPDGQESLGRAAARFGPSTARSSPPVTQEY